MPHSATVWPVDGSTTLFTLQTMLTLDHQEQHDIVYVFPWTSTFKVAELTNLKQPGVLSQH